MHKSATKCNETLSKWCKNKHGASKIMDTLEMYHAALQTSALGGPTLSTRTDACVDISYLCLEIVLILGISVRMLLLENTILLLRL
jgi:hypothetical protein